MQGTAGSLQGLAQEVGGAALKSGVGVWVSGEFYSCTYSGKGC